MSKPVDLHPRISAVSAIPHPNDPEAYLCNIPMCIRLAKETDTPQARKIYRLYLAEFRAREGWPLTHEQREIDAFMVAARRVGWKFTDGGSI